MREEGSCFYEMDWKEDVRHMENRAYWHTIIVWHGSNWSALIIWKSPWKICPMTLVTSSLVLRVMPEYACWATKKINVGQIKIQINKEGPSWKNIMPRYSRASQPTENIDIAMQQHGVTHDCDIIQGGISNHGRKSRTEKHEKTQQEINKMDREKNTYSCVQFCLQRS